MSRAESGVDSRDLRWSGVMRPVLEWVAGLNWVGIVPVLIGGLITALFSCLYYVKAGQELKREAERLARQNEAALKLLEVHGGGYYAHRDAEGQATGGLSVKVEPQALELAGQVREPQVACDGQPE